MVVVLDVIVFLCMFVFVIILVFVFVSVSVTRSPIELSESRLDESEVSLL